MKKVMTGVVMAALVLTLGSMSVMASDRIIGQRNGSSVCTAEGCSSQAGTGCTYGDTDGDGVCDGRNADGNTCGEQKGTGTANGTGAGCACGDTDGDGVCDGRNEDGSCSGRNEKGNGSGAGYGCGDTDGDGSTCGNQNGTGAGSGNGACAGNAGSTGNGSGMQGGRGRK